MAKPPPDITGRYPGTPIFGHPRFLPWLTNREAAERAAEKLLHRIAVLEAELASERAKKPERPALHCSFCAKSQHDVTKLIAGPNNFICNECVALCVDIICGKESPPPPKGNS